MQFHLPSDADTDVFGRRLAGVLRPGDMVLLSGGLGAGKTALARAILRALLGDDALEVPSPSFSLVQPYAGPAGPILHADLYRLGAQQDIDELGLFEDPAAIVLIEWPERAPALAGTASVAVELGIARSGGRDAQVTFADGRRFDAER
jgi:tRNA threonylcarbamoyl adenosine modification protein YjeE